MWNRARAIGAGVGAGQDHLEGDQTIQVDLAGLVNDPHAAAAQLLEDLVAGDGRPPGRSPVSRRGRVGRFEHAGRRRGIDRAAGGGRGAEPRSSSTPTPTGRGAARPFSPWSAGLGRPSPAVCTRTALACPYLDPPHDRRATGGRTALF